MLDNMTFIQFLEWRCYAELEPFDEEREDLRVASINRTMLNLWGWDRTKRPAYELSETVLRFGDSQVLKKPERTWQDLKSMARLISDGFNAQQAA